MEIKTEKEEKYIIEMKLDAREMSMLQALLGLGDLSDHLGKSFVEYREPSKPFFLDLRQALMDCPK